MEDTIVAIATAYGEGSIGIIRISGLNATNILNELFIRKGGEAREGNSSDISCNANRQLTYGHIVDPVDKTIVDEVMAVFMKAPATYTREDMVEIQCHGSIVSLRKILSLVLNNGARLAEPGEFTKRAFLNGRIDLSQAEAVIDVIKAKTDKSFQTALNQLDGSLSKKIRSIRQGLMEILIKLAVNIDYPDEDIEELAYEELIDSLLLIDNEINELLSTAQTGKIIKEGIKITIAGRPNVGKSTLLNLLLGEQRAIVTDIPGTTRDTIEEGLSLQGIPVYLTDTAGIHSTDDPVEKIGIDRSYIAFDRADLIVFIVDGSESLADDDIQIAKMLTDKKTIVMINKLDLGRQIFHKQLSDILPNATFIDSSLLDEKGIKELQDGILQLVYCGNLVQDNSEIITNARHRDILEKAGKAIKDGILMSCQFEAMDFIEVDVRHAWELLGDILGETVTEDIIDNVFSRFCLGK